jgi:very-short-patch-repair endonuclease
MELYSEMIKDYVSGQSSIEVAKKYNMALTTVTRILKKAGVTRSRSESQKMALDKGKSINPTKGVGHSRATKEALSETGAHRWAQLTGPERQVFSDQAKERWDKLDPEKKKEMQSKAGVALQKTSKEGSLAEKIVAQALMDAGYVVRRQVKNFMNGGYEIDILLPDLAIVVELDGPQHFLPIWGQEQLNKTIQQDMTKNGVLNGYGLTVIRVKYIVKNLTEKIKRDLCKQVKELVASVAANKTDKKLIEVEFKND